jgi:hypothetical protein
MTLIYKGVRSMFRATRSVGSFGVNIVCPAFGIPRPWSYLAFGFWLYFIGTIVYRIASR